MHLTLLEQETIVTYNQAEDSAQVFTNDKTLIRRLEKRGALAVSVNGYGAKTFVVPKSWVAIRPPARRRKGTGPAVPPWLQDRASHAKNPGSQPCSTGHTPISKGKVWVSGGANSTR